MSGKKHTAYRASVGRANYTSPDQPDIAHAVKETARGMGTSTTSDWWRLKRLAMYRKGKARLVLNFKW